MVARWDQAPTEKKPAKKRRPVRKGTWQCRVCMEMLEQVTWASVERHLDAHGGGRAEGLCFRPAGGSSSPSAGA